MKLTINNKELQNALTTIMPAIPSRSVIPINECVLIQVTESGIYFTGTNTNLTIETLAIDGLKDVEGGDMCVNFHELKAISSRLGDVPVTIEDKKGEIIVTADGDKWKAGKSIEAVHFEKGRPFNPSWGTPIEDDVTYYMEQALKCSNPKGGSSLWTDVWVNIEKGKMDIVGAGTAMMVHTSSVDDGVSFKGIVNPSFVKAVSNLNGSATMESDGKSLRIKTDKTQVTVILSEEAVPDYHKYHEEKDYNLEVSKDELLATVGRIFVYNPIGVMPHIVQLLFPKDSIAVKFEQPETNKSYDKTISATHELKVERMAFIATALQTALSIFPSTTKTVKMCIESHDKLIFLKSDEDPLILGLNPLAFNNNKNIQP